MAMAVSSDFQYGDYVLMDDGHPKLARLRLHIQEVTQRMVANVTSQTVEGTSWTREGLSVYLKMLRDDAVALEERLGLRHDGGFYHVRLGD